MKRKVIMCLLAAVLLAGSAQAQEKLKISLSFQEALKITYDENYLLKANQHEHRMAELEKKAAAGLRSPQINLVANYTYMSSPIGFDFNNLKQPIGQIVGKLPIPPDLGPILQQLMQADWRLDIQKDNFFVLGAAAVAPIYMGGKINAANNAAKIRIEESHQKNLQDKYLLCTELSERYFGLSMAHRVRDVRKEVLDGMQKHYDDAVQLEKNGIIAKGEKLYAEMYLTRAQSDYRKAQRDIISINGALENTLNTRGEYFPQTAMFVIRDLESVDFFVNHALQNSPLLKQVGLKEDLAKEGIRAERASLLPTLTAMGAANIYDYQLSDMLPRAAVGVTFSYPLFNGLSNINKYKASKEQLKRVEVLKQKATQDIITLIEKSYNDLISIGEQVDSYNATIAFAAEYLRIKEKAFSEGVAPSSDVVNAQLNLAKVKTEKMELAYKYDTAFARFLEVCGMSDRYIFYMLGAKAQVIEF